jgi:hypothetical protein
MSLSYTSKFGYYGLRVNPTLEQVVGTVRKPLHIPLPDRKAKWYANSPYRALILDAEEKYQNYERAAIDYRQAGADAPESAARVRPSDASVDKTFDRIDEHHRKIEEHEAIETSHQLMMEHESRKTAANRREILRLSHGPNRTNPTIEMEHAELDVAGVPHYMPMPRTLPPKAHFTRPLPQLAAYGQPQAPEFKPFEQLNMGQPDNVRAATLSKSQNMTYERLRDFVVQPTFST